MAPPPFTNTDLRGMFALVERGHGGRGSVAGLGFVAFDGEGSFEWRNRVSVPGETFASREIIDEVFSGRYTVDVNGLIALTPDSATEPSIEMAVRGIEERGDGRRITETSLIFRAPEARTGSLLTGTAYLRPDIGVFDIRSLSGTYVGAAIGDGGQEPMAGFGVLTYDGAGGFTEANVANIQGETVTIRRFVAGTDQGTYAVEPDGSGTVAGGGVMFVITRARVDGDVALALEYSFLVRDTVPVNGAHFTGSVRRISE
jgi:hypothetical protein